MSLQSRLIGASLTLGLLVTFSLPAFAQEQSSTTQEGAVVDSQQQRTERRGKRWHRGKRGMHGMRGMMRMLRELDLTDAQQQQARAIFERYDASTKPQRDEMRQLFEQKRQSNAEPDAQTQARAEALRAQFKESARLMHDELLTILTPEQRTKLEQMKQERKARHEERRARRQNQMNDNQ